MNEDVMKLLERGYEMATKTGDFIIQEGSILIQQFIAWKTFEHGMAMILGLFLIVGIPYLIRRLYKHETQYPEMKFLGKPTRFEDDDVQYIVGSLAVVISIFFGLIMFWINLFSFVKILVAPNVYLLEYILK